MLYIKVILAHGLFQSSLQLIFNHCFILFNHSHPFYQCFNRRTCLDDGVFEVCGTGLGFGRMSPALTISTISQVTDTEINI